jgi:lipid-binding SYLF domain-containing protein
MISIFAASMRQMTLGMLFASTMASLVAGSPAAAAESAASLEDDAQAALASLYSTTPSAKVLGDKAKAILVFPRIVKAGFIVAGAYGEGVAMRGGKVIGYYNSVAGSAGFQAGAQAYGYALFLMTDSAVEYLSKSGGWELGTGPSLVVVDVGAAASLTTTTLKSDVYAFIFDQKGLMGGLGIQGSKITKISK